MTLLTFLTLHSTSLMAIDLQLLEKPDILTSKVVKKFSKADPLVVVFLSAQCPCSNSHSEELKMLRQTYGFIRFIGVHSNPEEGTELGKTYFSNLKLGFPVIRDDSLKIADAFKALKTPHAFILNNGEIVYQGGVSDRSDFSKASKHYLRDALESVKNHVPILNSQTRTLGCAIRRGE
ncbi:MAG: redoxin domain-containing protein [Oligoflexia bacterium]|nr:redoxin domain-containing protein [Oligoflexia bacterium]